MKLDFISVRFGGDYALMVYNIKEVYGHDDSLPFNADFEIMGKNSKILLKGKAWNDGWGGDSEMHIENYDRETVDKFDGMLKDAFSYKPKGYNFTINMGLASTIENLVEDNIISGHSGCYKERDFKLHLIND